MGEAALYDGWVSQKLPHPPNLTPRPLPQTGGPPGVLGPKREAKAFMQKNNSPFFFFFCGPTITTKRSVITIGLVADTLLTIGTQAKGDSESELL